MIAVEQTGEADPLAFAVTIREGTGATRHHVTMSLADYERFARGGCSPKQCIEAAFRFLLDREPKEAILRRFDVSVIARYFPNFADELRRYIARRSAAGDG